MNILTPLSNNPQIRNQILALPLHHLRRIAISTAAGQETCRSRQSPISRAICRKLHNGPSDTIKREVIRLEKKRKRSNPKKNQLYVDVPESRKWLDTATMPLILTAVGTALFAKILMMIDESREQELLERKIKNAPEGQGTVRMLTREEWDYLREERPRTPFESSIARPNAKIRTGEPLHMEDVKDWTLDVFTDAFTRAEETAKRGSA